MSLMSFLPFGPFSLFCPFAFKTFVLFVLCKYGGGRGQKQVQGVFIYEGDLERNGIEPLTSTMPLLRSTN